MPVTSWHTPLRDTKPPSHFEHTQQYTDAQNQNIKTPSECKYYSVNESYYSKWADTTQKTISFLRDNYSLRYVGSLIADFHRNLLNGGVFLYPENKDHPNGKLRLLYEILPLSYIIENAGGIASTGKANPLTIKPSHHHEKTPLIIGSKKIVTKILSILFISCSISETCL